MEPHTPGPWAVGRHPDDSPGWTPVYGPLPAGCAVHYRRDTIAYATPGLSSAANAAMIASAPDLLEALQTVRPLMIPGMNWTDETGELVKAMVSAAIAKATGAS